MGGKRQARREVNSPDRQRPEEGAPSAVTERDGVLMLTVRVTPRASRNELSFDGTVLRARLTAPPVEGAANEALVELLATRLDIPRRAVAILRGHTARTKTIAVMGVSAATFQQRFGS